MSLARRLVLRLWNAVSPGRAEQEVARELASHLALIEEDLQRRGMSADAARTAARQAIGGIEQVKDRHRDERSFVWLDDARRDVRYAVRTLLRAPGFTVVVVATLALGIGANTAMFSVVNAVLLKPLPYQDANRLASLVENIPGSETRDGEPRRRPVTLGVRDLAELRLRTTAFTHAGIATLSFMTMSGGDGITRMEGLRVSPAIVQMRGVQPLLGRLFDRRDEALGAEPVIILGYGAWRRYFAGAPDIIGRTVTLDDVFARDMMPDQAVSHTYTIVGVMAESYEDGQAQFWIPFALTSPAERAPGGGLSVRLAPGVSPRAAADEIGAIILALRGDRPSRAPSAPAPARFTFVLSQESLVAPVRPALIALLVAVGFVLLIACVNVANLVLARTAARRRELGIRVALGAGRGRVVRQLVTESLLLALVGGVVGMLLATGAVALLQSLGTTLSRMDLGLQLPFPRLREIGVDGSVLAFSLATAMATGLLCGLGPALRHSHGDRIEAARSRTRNVLVVAEIAMAMTLLVGGGLMLRGFAKLSTVDLGFNPARVLTFQVGLPPDRYPSRSPRLVTFAEELVARLRSVPGVQAAAYGRQLPLVAIVESSSFRRTPEPPARLGPDAVDTRLVSRDYLNVMGISVNAGRGFREADGAGQPPVLLINEALARREFPIGNAVGQLVYVGRGTVPWEIVGVVDDVRQSGQEEVPTPQLFADFRQWPEINGLGFTFLGPYYALRTDREPSSVVASIRSAARSLEPEAGVYSVATMEDLVSNRISRPRMYTVLLGIFSGLAVLLAVIGLYGVMAYAVAQQTREIGIRMALGARRSQVMALVLRHSASLASIGILIGLGSATALTRYLEGLLFGVSPLDPTTFAAVTLLFALVAMVAACVPARRATTVDPLVALRNE